MRTTKAAKEALNPLLPGLVRSAQEVYDAWEQDEEGFSEEYAGGGICDDVADSMADVMGRAGFIVRTRHYPEDNHTVVWWLFEDQIYEVDIPFRIYERGSFYRYVKVQDVQLTPDDVTVLHVSDEPDEFEEEWP